MTSSRKLAGLPGGRDFSGTEQIEEESESVLNAVSILVKTREATHCADGEGCLLTANLNKQISLHASQLESFSGPSRDTSVIRCVSTPSTSISNLVSFNFIVEQDLELQLRQLYQHDQSLRSTLTTLKTSSHCHQTPLA